MGLPDRDVASRWLERTKSKRRRIPGRLAFDEIVCGGTGSPRLHCQTHRSTWRADPSMHHNPYHWQPVPHRVNAVNIGSQSHEPQCQRSSLTRARVDHGKACQRQREPRSSLLVKWAAPFCPWHSREPWCAQICTLGTPPRSLYHRQITNSVAGQSLSLGMLLEDESPHQDELRHGHLGLAPLRVGDGLVREEAHGSGPSWRGGPPYRVMANRIRARESMS